MQDYLERGLLIIALLSGVPLVVGSVATLIVAALQTATQIQDQTITHLVRFSVVALFIYLTGETAMGILIDYIRQLLYDLSACAGPS